MQPFGDPFGDSPFKAIPSEEPQNFSSTSSLQLSLTTAEYTEPSVQKVETVTNTGFTDVLPTSNFIPTDVPLSQTVQNSQYFPQEAQSIPEHDILAGILPPSAPLPTTSFPASQMPTANPAQAALSSQTPFSTVSSQPSSGDFMHQSGSSMPSLSHITAQNMNVPSVQQNHQSALPHSLSSTALAPYAPQEAQSGTTGQQNNNNFLGDLLPQAGPPGMLLSAKSVPPGLVNSPVPQQHPTEKFEPKSTIWADTLSRGLVDFNISGRKFILLSPNSCSSIELLRLLM